MVHVLTDNFYPNALTRMVSLSPLSKSGHSSNPVTKNLTG